MSRTITAMFDTRADAEAGEARLKAASISVSDVHIADQSTQGYSAQGPYSSQDNKGIWGSLKSAMMPDEDRHTYEEGVRRGSCVLTASVSDDDVDEAIRVLEETSTVDIDQRSDEWRKSGWDYAAPTAAVGTAAMSTKPTANTTGDQVIPIVEEQLIVGKRDAARGGVRVRSYVTETPVHEQVTLRDEKVQVERRPVDRKLDTVDASAFQERTIEMTETDEEAVVGKTARVVEEVVLTKDVSERVETINDTVRRTEVEVERDPQSSTAKSTTPKQGY